MSYYRENPDYMQGWKDGFAEGWDRRSRLTDDFAAESASSREETFRKFKEATFRYEQRKAKKKKRKLSKWQQFVKANSKKKKYIYQGGGKKGKLNLKKMGVDYRKKNR